MDNIEKVERVNIVKKIQDFASNQDNNQKINVAISVALELYRVLVSSLLILFVPQDCHGHLCTLTENMETNSQIYTTGLFFNFATMFVFLVMYTLEVKRENRLITYLDVNKSTPCDNASVGEVLQKLPSEKQNSIIVLDMYYQKAAYVAMVSFVINSIISGIVVYQYSLGNQTTTTIITNILFMVSKMSDVYLTVNTEKNVFYSAYLKGKIQYNDVDPDKIRVIELVEFGDIESPKEPGDSVIKDPVIEGPVIKDPVIEGPVIEGPVIEGPVIEGPVVEGPVVEGPVIEGPVIEGLVIEEIRVETEST
jgi:cytochrome b subunit of formate dehydrogenase